MLYSVPSEGGHSPHKPSSDSSNLRSETRLVADGLTTAIKRYIRRHTRRGSTRIMLRPKPHNGQRSTRLKDFARTKSHVYYTDISVKS